jgi:uncharacterized protein (DUF433 family)
VGGQAEGGDCGGSWRPVIPFGVRAVVCVRDSGRWNRDAARRTRNSGTGLRYDMDATLARHIERAPDLSRGRARIAGTRVRVQDIVACHEFQGLTPDEIVAGYPHITLADVHAALAYYHDHRDEIRQQMREDEDFVARFCGSDIASAVDNDADADSVAPR